MTAETAETPAKATRPGRRPAAMRSGGKRGHATLLKERAFQAIREGILSERFPAGSFISERQIAAWLKMSKTPVRAAFERLEGEGFVTTSPQQGVVVRELTLHEVADHFELRQALESFVVRNLAGRLTPEQIAQLNANLEQQHKCAEMGDIQGGVRLDGEFHLLLCSFFRNEEIQRVMWQTRDRMYGVISRVHARHPERIKTNYPEHRAIAEAIIAGDGDEAAARLLEHLEHGKQFLLSPRRAR